MGRYHLKADWRFTITTSGVRCANMVGTMTTPGRKVGSGSTKVTCDSVGVSCEWMARCTERLWYVFRV